MRENADAPYILRHKNTVQPVISMDRLDGVSVYDKENSTNELACGWERVEYY